MFLHSCAGEGRAPCPLGSPYSAKIHQTQTGDHTIVKWEQVWVLLWQIPLQVHILLPQTAAFPAQHVWEAL